MIDRLTSLHANLLYVRPSPSPIVVGVPNAGEQTDWLNRIASTIEGWVEALAIRLNPSPRPSRCEGEGVCATDLFDLDD